MNQVKSQFIQIIPVFRVHHFRKYKQNPHSLHDIQLLAFHKKLVNVDEDFFLSVYFLGVKLYTIHGSQEWDQMFFMKLKIEKMKCIKRWTVY